jgi:(E)-4-hydroxy-3-methyl-but-2-enyl pyrophosphate reductase
MSVKLAQTAGFCMGVKRAVDMVLDIAQHKGKENIYTYGPLIHNPQTVEILRKRGIVPIKNIDDIDFPDKQEFPDRPDFPVRRHSDKEPTIIIRAHGISPQERKKIKDRGIKIIDATCPKVAHVQAIIKKHASRDYTIIIIGDGDHPEVNGLLGYADGKGIVINNSTEVDHLPALDKVCIVAQTTQNIDDFNALVSQVRKRFPDTVVFDTICDSTEKRQAEVKHLAAEMDAMIVIGGRNSANTRRLADISELQGKPTFHIETAEELNHISIKAYEKIGVSAGASTPNWIIDRVVDGIAEDRSEKAEKGRLLFKSWVFMVRTDIYSSIGAGCLSLASILLQKLPVNILNIFITCFYVYAMHTLNRLINRKSSTIIGSFREESYRMHENLYISIAIISMVLALAFSYFTGMRAFTLLFMLSLFGILYNMKIFPKNFRFTSLKELPGSKNIAMALAWAAVASVLPWIEHSLTITPGMIVAFIFTFMIVFVRSSMSDILDIQSDRLIGKETIPVLIGKEKTQMLLLVILVLLGLLLLVAHPLGWTSTLSYALLISVFFIWIYFNLYDRRAAFSGVVLEGILETNYILTGFCAILWLVLI